MVCAGLVAEGDGQAGPQTTTLTMHDATLTERGRQTTTRLLTGKVPLPDKLPLGKQVPVR